MNKTILKIAAGLILLLSSQVTMPASPSYNQFQNAVRAYKADPSEANEEVLCNSYDYFMQKGLTGEKGPRGHAEAIFLPGQGLSLGQVGSICALRRAGGAPVRVPTGPLPAPIIAGPSSGVLMHEVVTLETQIKDLLSHAASFDQLRGKNAADIKKEMDVLDKLVADFETKYNSLNVIDPTAASKINKTQLVKEAEDRKNAVMLLPELLRLETTIAGKLISFKKPNLEVLTLTGLDNKIEDFKVSTNLYKTYYDNLVKISPEASAEANTHWKKIIDDAEDALKVANSVLTNKKLIQVQLPAEKALNEAKKDADEFLDARATPAYSEKGLREEADKNINTFPDYVKRIKDQLDDYSKKYEDLKHSVVALDPQLKIGYDQTLSNLNERYEFAKAVLHNRTQPKRTVHGPTAAQVDQAKQTLENGSKALRAVLNQYPERNLKVEGSEVELNKAIDEIRKATKEYEVILEEWGSYFFTASNKKILDTYRDQLTYATRALNIAESRLSQIGGVESFKKILDDLRLKADGAFKAITATDDTILIETKIKELNLLVDEYKPNLAKLEGFAQGVNPAEKQAYKTALDTISNGIKRAETRLAALQAAPPPPVLTGKSEQELKTAIDAAINAFDKATAENALQDYINYKHLKGEAIDSTYEKTLRDAIAAL